MDYAVDDFDSSYGSFDDDGFDYDFDDDDVVNVTLFENGSDEDQMIQIQAAVGDDKDCGKLYQHLMYSDGSPVFPVGKIRVRANRRRQVHLQSKRRGRLKCPEFTPRLLNRFEPHLYIDQLYTRAKATSAVAPESSSPAPATMSPPPTRSNTNRGTTFARGTMARAARKQSNHADDDSSGEVVGAFGVNRLANHLDEMSLKGTPKKPLGLDDYTWITPSECKHIQLSLGGESGVQNMSAFLNDAGRHADDGTKKIRALVLIVALKNPIDADLVST